MHTVYVAVNIINGERYVGCTSVGLMKRKKTHLEKSRNEPEHCPKFYNAIRKFGAKNFAWKTLATFNDKMEAFAYETKTIRRFKAEYNTASKEDYAAHNRFKVLCLETGEIHASVTHAAKSIKAGNGEVSMASLVKFFLRLGEQPFFPVI